MNRYLTQEQLSSNLNMGKPIEQWLPHLKKEDYTIIKWLRIDRERDNTFIVAYFEAFDEGNETFFDVYEFSTLDPDKPYGQLSAFKNAIDAISFCIQNYGAKENKFVNNGMIQEEYAEYLKGFQ
jgi:hypothetical protein